MAKTQGHKKKSVTAKKDYEAVLGFNYGKQNTRIEPGEKLKDVPASVIKDLLSQKAIREVE